MVNIIAELKPVFKDRKKHVIHCFTNEKNIAYRSPVTKLKNIILLKKKTKKTKDLNESFKGEKRYYSDGFFCSIIIC